MRQQFGEKFAPNRDEDQKKRSSLRFDGIFSRKLTFYQPFFSYKLATLNFYKGALNLNGGRVPPTIQVLDK